LHATAQDLSRLRRIMHSNGFVQILLDAPSCGAGASDGGCLIVAKGLQLVLGGEVVRIDSALNDGSTQAEHYGLLLPSGQVVDGGGIHPSTAAWLDHFEAKEAIGRPLSLASGVDDSGEIPDDPRASKEIASYVSARI
jgi:hypothetical protein